MSKEFRGFSELPETPSDIFQWVRLFDEMGKFLLAIVGRLGQRVAGVAWHAGRDERAQRDYFYANFEIHLRGKKDTCFIGFFHFGSAQRSGSFYQVWEWEHDSEPVVNYPLDHIYNEVREAQSKGLLGDYIEERAAEAREALGLN